MCFDGLQLNLGGYMINDFNKFGRVYSVMIQAQPQFRRGPEDIRGIYVRNANGQMVPLSTLVKVGSESAPILINRYNMFRSAELVGQNAPGFSSGDAIATMDRLSRHLPRGFGYEWTGLAFQEKLASGQAGYIFAFSLLLLFLVLAALYENWAIPFGVILGIPITVFGALLGIWFRGLANDVYVQVGIVMLIGLNAKLSIMIVEFAKNKRDLEGFSTFEAAKEGRPAAFPGHSDDCPGRSLRVVHPAFGHRRRRRGPLVGGHHRGGRHGRSHGAERVLYPGALLRHRDPAGKAGGPPNRSRRSQTAGIRPGRRR